MTLFSGPWGLSLVIVMAAAVSGVWRVAGAVVASRIDENSLAFRYVRAVATALIAAIVAQLTLFPTGTMATVPVALRFGAMAAGLAAYLSARRSMVVGTVVCEVILAGGTWWWG